jgi:hypothetical protein
MKTRDVVEKMHDHKRLDRGLHHNDGLSSRRANSLNIRVGSNIIFIIIDFKRDLKLLCYNRGKIAVFILASKSKEN